MHKSTQFQARLVLLKYLGITKVVMKSKSYFMNMFFRNQEMFCKKQLSTNIFNNGSSYYMHRSANVEEKEWINPNDNNENKHRISIGEKLKLELM